MKGLAPQDKRCMRETIVTNFFSCVGDKQVEHLDNCMEKIDVCNFSYKGVNYHNSFTTGGNFRPLHENHYEMFDKFLLVYSTLEMEMASLSSLLTRLMRPCNSLADMKAVIPLFLHRYMWVPEIGSEVPEDHDKVYLLDVEIAELHEQNEKFINEAKVRCMRDQVFS